MADYDIGFSVLQYAGDSPEFIIQKIGLEILYAEDALKLRINFELVVININMYPDNGYIMEITFIGIVP